MIDIGVLTTPPFVEPFCRSVGAQSTAQPWHTEPVTPIEVHPSPNWTFPNIFLLLSFVPLLKVLLSLRPFFHSRLVEQRFRVETLIKQHQEKITELEKTPEGDLSDEQKEEIESHTESVQALQTSLTPAELGQLSTLSGRLAK